MATDGQTLAGAISTGCHDAAIHFGSIQEHVKGIHLVIPGETVYVQKNSDPVLTEEYVINTLGADRLITNDDMFNAALVSFGSFGVVHSYLLQTEKIFKLKVEVSLGVAVNIETLNTSKPQNSHFFIPVRFESSRYRKLKMHSILLSRKISRHWALTYTIAQFIHISCKPTSIHGD